MTQKFNRNYRLTIYPIDGGDPIIITPPFTIEFSCNRNQNAHINTLSLDVFNLSESNRRRIFQDIAVRGQYANNQVSFDGQDLKSLNILLEIGYGTFLYRVFYGRMMQADSARDGTEIVTHIEATSSLWDLTGTDVNTTLAAGIDVTGVLLYLISQFPNLTLGAVGDFPEKFSRPVVLNGNSWQLLKEYSGGNVYVDNGKVYVLTNKEVLPEVFVIDDSTGILQTPRRQLSVLTIVTLMEPAINVIGQQVQIQSSVMQEYNGQYKVLGIHHQGIISAAVSGNMKSAFILQATDLFNGFSVLNPVSAA